MKTEITLFRTTRQNTHTFIKQLSLEQVNHIPDGFTGNIAWHLGHMVVTHKGLVYQLSGLQSEFDKDFVSRFKKGSVPQTPISQEELDFLANSLLTQVDELEKDLENKVFGTTTAYKTSYNFEITTTEEAVKFNNLHQALHLGYMMALKRSI